MVSVLVQLRTEYRQEALQWPLLKDKRSCFSQGERVAVQLPLDRAFGSGHTRLLQKIGKHMPVDLDYHACTTSVTSTTFLGCISVAKECYQIGFLEKFIFPLFNG